MPPLCPLLLPLLLLTSGLASSQTETPLGIKTCADDQPDVAECRRSALQEAIPRLAAGLPQIGAAPVDPLGGLEPLAWQASSRGVALKFRLDSVNISGLARAVVDHLTVDTENKALHIVSHVDGFSAEGAYTMAGRLLGVPLDGSGLLKLSMRSATFDVRCAGHLQSGEGGQDFLSIDSVTVKLQLGDAHFQLTGLFGDYKPLVEAGNTFVNAVAWGAVRPHVQPTLERWLAGEFGRRAQAVFSAVPYRRLFPKTAAHAAFYRAVFPQYV